jgi:hypothetical protein
MKRCYWCGKEGIPDDAQMCDDCRVAGKGIPPATAVTLGIGQPVRIVDLDMPFGSMVTLLVKISIAAIPAAIILLVIVFLCAAFLGAVFGGLSSLL